MNMPKSRGIQAKISLPQAIWNFGCVTVNGVNSNYVVKKTEKNLNLVLTNTVSSYILVFVDATEIHRQQAVRV